MERDNRESVAVLSLHPFIAAMFRHLYGGHKSAEPRYAPEINRMECVLLDDIIGKSVSRIADGR